ncbi:MAG: pirin family protein [Proteobacteria bacterium]|jgi:redox-sensitive bicupin YhaK (pirin superfamily)|nr:pirin family protein [Pseudomonadota bacterium]
MPGPLRLLAPHVRDLGGFRVRRLLPAFERKMVGPFIFLDHLGPVDFPPGEGMDVRPHPHIGLATVTYLFEGAILHRDSLGSVQRITAGDVNWMTAGRGIAHSERTPPEERSRGQRMHGLQTWVALPHEHEFDEPSFTHVARERLPKTEHGGARLTVVAGRAYGMEAPTPTFGETLYVAAELDAGATLALPPEHDERAVYAIDGDVTIDGEPVPAAHLALLDHAREVAIAARGPARVMLIGGAKADGDRYIWWNFVASTRGAIEQAKEAWREKRFAPVPGDAEFIPLPER